MSTNIKKALLGIIMAIVAISSLYPLFWLILFSFKDNTEIFGGNIAGLPSKLLWGNYKEALVNAKVSNYFLNSVIVTGVTIVATWILSLTSSYAVTRMIWKFRHLTLAIILLGLMIPLNSALLPLFIILKHLRMLNSYGALMIPYTAFAIPMAVFILTGFLKGIPRELEEAACIDGCTIYNILYIIIFPLVKPALATIAIFTYLSTWNELMFAVTFISDSKYKTITVGIQSLVGQYSTSWGPIGAGLVVATIPTIVIYILMSSQVQKSLTAGAVKG
ncbi:carbohydrate ABC transporter permease [Paenibacillus psychroresistens]|nr:carbohydrate ABC transporter permease [Paenibacillus psychroresistens]